MADLPRHPDTDDDTPLGPDRESTASTPLRTYVLAAIVIAAVLLFVVLHLTGTIGPGSH